MTLVDCNNDSTVDNNEIILITVRFSIYLSHSVDYLFINLCALYYLLANRTLRYAFRNHAIIIFFLL